MNILLWVLQALVALVYGASGVMKVFMLDTVSEGVPSFGALPRQAGGDQRANRDRHICWTKDMRHAVSNVPFDRYRVIPGSVFGVRMRAARLEVPRAAECSVIRS